MNESPHSIWITIRYFFCSSQDNSEETSHKNILEFDQLKHNFEDLRRLYEIQAEELKKAFTRVCDLNETVDMKTQEVKKERKDA